MFDVGVIGGYPIRSGTPAENDFLWFTGRDWMLVHWGNKGEEHTKITAPYENVNFICGGFMVEVADLDVGDVLWFVTVVPSDALLANKVSCKIVNLPYAETGVTGGSLALFGEAITGESQTETYSVGLPTVSYSVSVS